MKLFPIALFALSLFASEAAAAPGEHQATVLAAPAPLSSDYEPVPRSTALSQADPLWRNLSLGGRGATMKNAGCLVTSLLMVALETGFTFSSPLSFVEVLNRSHLLTSSGSMVWDIGRALPGLTASRLYLKGSAAVTATRLHIARGAHVLLEVVTARGTRHWVAVSRLLEGDIEVLDPNGGKVGSLAALYGARAIIGMAIIQKN